MPAILSELEEIEMWLKPGPWSPELQKLIRPFEGKLECYKVPQEVGSVKNDSPDFIKVSTLFVCSRCTCVCID